MEVDPAKPKWCTTDNRLDRKEDVLSKIANQKQKLSIGFIELAQADSVEVFLM